MKRYAEQFSKEVFLRENQPLAEILRLETSLREARRVLWEWVDHTQFRQYSEENRRFLHPLELDPPQMGAVEMVDIETGASKNYDVTAEAVKKYTQRIEEWQKTLEMACIENWASYTHIPTDWVLEREVLAHLRAVQVVTPL